MIAAALLLAILLVGLSGIPGLFLGERSLTGQRWATGLVTLGGILGLGLVGWGIATQQSIEMAHAWQVPWGRFSIKLDALGAVFVIPVFLAPLLGSIYGLGYWSQEDHPQNGRKLRLFYGLLAASMALVTLARDGVLFLIAWEIMALSAYFLVTTEDEDASACKSGWIYLIATHMGTLCLIAMFLLLRGANGSFELSPLSDPRCTGIFLLAVAGFAFKAGLLPLHVWLPGAHANAPSHVSALLSGVMIKMGIYGLVRITSLLPPGPVWWGAGLLGAGALSGTLGIAFALGQSDLKRTLAYSSIENMGIVAMGLGLALLGRTLGRWEWVALGLGGALLHVWNHSLFKTLLFFAAGAVVHATQTREIDRLGGLAKKMPRVTVLFGVGALAISALPPLNGFASELLLYAGFFRAAGGPGPASPLAALGAPVLALIGALAVACFVNLLGTVFLGSPRSPASSEAHEPPATMQVPMGVLALGCLWVGLFPWQLTPALDRAIETWGQAPSEPLSGLVPLGKITLVTGGFLGAAALAVGLLGRTLVRRRPAAAGTWDCGYARPSARMQYTGSSFRQMLVALLGGVLWPRIQRPRIHGVFPSSAKFASQIPDPVLDRAVVPVFRVAGRAFPWFRVFQRGHIQAYVLYFLVILMILFLWGNGGY
jgi:hydrogenase-4 component B